jgi:hypothetical protein
MRATAAPDRVPVRSVTRAVSGGTATSAAAGTAASSNAKPAAARADRQAPYCAGAGFGAGAEKSTLGGLEIAASFSTVKVGFGL